MRLFHRAVVSAFAALNIVMSGVAAQDEHRQHTRPKPARTELGTSVAVDAQGKLWAVSKEVAGEEQYVVLQVSSDAGASWSSPRRVQAQPEAVSADGENRPKLAFGTKGEIYISYTRPLAKPYTGEIRLVRSLDGGKTFLPPLTVHADRDVITHRFDSLIVDR